MTDHDLAIRRLTQAGPVQILRKPTSQKSVTSGNRSTFDGASGDDAAFELQEQLTILGGS